MDTENTKKEITTVSDVTSLNGVESKKFCDFDHHFCYVRVKDPDSKSENILKHFNVFYKDKIFDKDKNVVDSDWKVVSNGLVSDKFSVVKSEDVLNSVKKSFEGKVENINVRFEGVTSKVNFVMSDWNIGKKDEEVDKFIFGISSYINIDEVDKGTQLGFSIINGYAGNISLNLRYFIHHSYVEKGTGQKKSFDNPYLFSMINEKMIHNNGMAINFSVVPEISNYMAEIVKKYKNIKVNEDVIEKFEKVMNKKQKTIFEESIAKYLNDEEFKNLYYLTYLVSSIAEFQKSMYMEFKLKNIFASFSK